MTAINEEAISRTYSQRGYLVIARKVGDRDLRIGEVLLNIVISPCDPETVQPMRVSSKTDVRDFLDQDAVLHFPRVNPVPLDPSYDRFYRVEGD